MSTGEPKPGPQRSSEEELRLSLARVIEAADDERRRIGRDIHDGAQQDIVVIGHYLDMARKQLESDPAAAAELIDKAREQTARMGADLRDLARGLRPSCLDDQGLGAAISVLAANSSVPVKVEALPEHRLPDAVEVALFYLVSAAVAGARREVSVAIEQHGPTVAAEVVHDGDAVTELVAVTDRVAALGGNLEVQPGKLRAEIPISESASR